MAETKEEDKRSTRTKMLDAEYEKTKSPIMNFGRGLSRLGDAVGFTQEEEYKGKTKEELAKKKRAGGKIVNENMMMKKEGRGMAKADMQKVASKAVKGHEKRMHKMASGGLAAGHKSADGIAKKGKTRCKVC
jgi:hypothetical protein